jgi:hypothetical protein
MTGRLRRKVFLILTTVPAAPSKAQPAAVAPNPYMGAGTRNPASIGCADLM